MWPKPPYYYLRKHSDPPRSEICQVCYHGKIEHYVRVEKVKGRKRRACNLCIREADRGCAAGKPKKKLRKAAYTRPK